MANRLSRKRSVDPDIFKKYLKDRELSIRELGKVLDTNERTIRRLVDSREVTITVALDICSYFNDTCTNIFGPTDSLDWYETLTYLE